MSVFYGYTIDHGLLSNNVSCIEKDTDNNIWIGYDDKGAVSCIKQGTIKSIRVTHESVFNGVGIHHMHFSKKRHWIATQEGLMWLDGENLNFFPWAIRDLEEFPEGHVSIGGVYGTARFTMGFIDSFKMPARLTEPQKRKYNIRGLQKKNRT